MHLKIKYISHHFFLYYILIDVMHLIEKINVALTPRPSHPPILKYTSMNEMIKAVIKLKKFVQNRKRIFDRTPYKGKNLANFG